MAGLKETEYEGEVVWLGYVPANSGSLRSQAKDSLDLQFGGVAGEQHEGVRRPSCSRVTNLYLKGTEITNTRQLSILSSEEMDEIARGMGMAELDPALIGASMILRGIPDLTHLPPSSRLQFASGATLTVDLENGPCVFPAREIEAEAPGFGKGFIPAATGRRGLTAWVERPGRVSLGDRLRLFVPDQRSWTP
ncbi:sulfurase [Sedimentitalea sp. JM2-8]|uniref:Sulfurase n=1 Tax=Sedimentitalea xiamensis TaxID=3050037 RepID=A0ABT7FDR7_9RHOB|nr:MOSC domain-containing protein [Sedimentitalea xiamensis]MDK3073256.1 sulfurase [Sedimentitalea xiamensis]